MEHLAAAVLLLPPHRGRWLLHAGTELTANASNLAAPSLQTPPPSESARSSGSGRAIRAEVYIGIVIPFLAILTFLLLNLRTNGWARSLWRSRRRQVVATGGGGGVLRHSGDDYLGPCVELKEVQVVVVEQPDDSKLFGIQEESSSASMAGDANTCTGAYDSSSRSRASSTNCSVGFGTGANCSSSSSIINSIAGSELDAGSKPAACAPGGGVGPALQASAADGDCEEPDFHLELVRHPEQQQQQQHQQAEPRGQQECPTEGLHSVHDSQH